jgi:hypothetical protein
MIQARFVRQTKRCQAFILVSPKHGILNPSGEGSELLAGVRRPSACRDQLVLRFAEQVLESNRVLPGLAAGGMRGHQK